MYSSERGLCFARMVFPIYLHWHHIFFFALVLNFKFFLASLDSFVDEINVRWIFLVKVEAYFIDEHVHKLSVPLMAKPKEDSLLLFLN
jgi:hypothetical protein